MGQWADYLISAVKYDTNKKIVQAKQHRDSGDEIGKGELITRDELATNLKKGVRYSTIFNGNSNWKKGDSVHFIRVGSDYSIRTDSNKVEFDNLRMLPELD